MLPLDAQPIIRRLDLTSDGDARMHQNKAGNMAYPIACRWAGAVFELLEHLGRGSEAKDCKKKQKQNKKT